MDIIQFSYMLAAVLFIIGIKSLSSPETARRGMNLAMLGMFIAILGTLFHQQIVTYSWIIAGIIVGSLLSIPISLWIPMTELPQRIALSHAGGALSALLIGIVEYHRFNEVALTWNMGVLGTEVALAGVTFTGSLIVAAKLHGTLRGQAILYKGQNIISLALFILMINSVALLAFNPQIIQNLYLLCFMACIFGIFLVLPVGAADMPVVIAIFNAYGGLTSAVMGFMLGNKIQIITGALDGASGFILAMLMCRAMNRSVANVLFGAAKKVEGKSNNLTTSVEGQAFQSINIEDMLHFFEGAKSIIIVPGYGMAVSQAQHILRELANQLKAKGANIKYAIHPVAGRMPGHMNVLLAEADIPYTELVDMEDINPEFPFADIVLIVGANDVTNPVARHMKSNPIYGMPILDVDKAKKIIVFKRGMNPGFSGIENELYFRDNTWMVFGDAKESLTKLVYQFRTI